MSNKNREGSYYAAKVRLFLNEYGGIDLEEFCKAEKVSYSKMCHCLGRPSYRKPKPSRCDAKSDAVNTPPTIELQPLVVDFPDSQTSAPVPPQAASPSDGVGVPRPTGPANTHTLSGLSISLRGHVEIRLGSCDIKTLVTLLKEMEVRLC